MIQGQLVVIVGAGDHGRVVLELLRASGVEVAGFVEPTSLPDRPSVDGVAVIGNLGQDTGWLRAEPAFVVALGDNRRRAAAFDRCLELGVEPVSAVHPSAIILAGASIERGAVVCAGAVIGLAATVSANAIINTAASIDHDVVIGRHGHVAPGARLAGHVSVGDGALIGIGAAVREGCSIGDWAVVAGGAMVVTDIPAGAWVAGVPARPMTGRPR